MKEYFTNEMKEEIFNIFQALYKSKSDIKMDQSKLMLQIMREHQSNFEYWESEGFDEFEWDDQSINPLQHIIMHYIVEDYLNKETPLSEKMKTFYKKRKRKLMKHHDIVHMLAQIIAVHYFREKRGEGKFNLEAVYKDLEKYATWNKAKFWNLFVPDDEETEEDEVQYI